jgi:hypothetical protein
VPNLSPPCRTEIQLRCNQIFRSPVHACCQPQYSKAFNTYLRRGTPIDLSFKQARPTTHYVWRTRGDKKVRSSHSANNGKIFSWDNPPPTGHPGEDYGCRCNAEPVNLSSTAPNEAIVTHEFLPWFDSHRRWNDLNLVLHFYLG